MCKGIYQCTGRGIEKTTNDEHGYSAADLSRWKKLSKHFPAKKKLGLLIILYKFTTDPIF